ncbi:regulator of chromosome condensation (RCC1) repeat domain-containing protein [Phthorimaea operculella]|nr:regulator of chromosome condensation (RCC1) repeat domain-containing protein [Phthorimaea operculella]
MNYLKVLLPRRSISLAYNRAYVTTKKKVSDPNEDEDLPIFQYPVSKSSDRRIYVWGLAETGALGIHLPRGKRGRKAYKNNFTLAWHPMRSGFAERFDVTQVACGYGFTLAAIKTNEQHKVFGTGINTDSQIGYHAPRMGRPLELLLSPAPIYIPYKSLECKIKGLAAGRAHSVILTDSEGVYTLGNNAYGQCGRKINPKEEYKGSMVSHHIKKLGGEEITDYTVGPNAHSIACLYSKEVPKSLGHPHGFVYTLGNNAYGQCGRKINPKEEYKGSMVSHHIKKLGGEEITDVCCGQDHTRFLSHSVILTDSEGVYTLGNNAYGQCGRKINPKEEYKGSMVSHHIKKLGGEEITDVCCGQDHTRFLSHSVILTDSEGVYTLGNNAYGQCGRKVNPKEEYKGSMVSHHIKKLGGEEITDVCCGQDHTRFLSHSVILTDSEGVYTLGNNAYGQCGRKINPKEEYKGSMVSHHIKKLGGEEITDVCCGQDHTLFITESGKVYACGWGADGQTGLGSYDNQGVPAPVKGDITTERIVKIASTGDSVLALNVTINILRYVILGFLYACGWGADGQTALGSYDNQGVPAPVKGDITTERIVKIASTGDSVLALNASSEFSLSVTSTLSPYTYILRYVILGFLFACGWGADGQTGLGSYDNQGVPAPVKGDITTERIVKIASTGDSVLALNVTINILRYVILGFLYACGWGADGQTGLGRYDNQGVPAPVKGDITTERIVKIASTGDSVLALNDRGELFGWGNSEYGQVPMQGGQQQVNMSYSLLSLTRGLGKIVDIAAGGSFCLIVNDQGDVFVWGYGLLGLGPNVQHSKKPKLIPPPLFGRNEFNPECMVEKVACGIGHLAAITNGGDLYMWGRNRHGCLGLGHAKDQEFPLKVSVGAHVLSVHCSVDHTIAMCRPYV